MGSQGSQGVGQSHRWLAVVEKCESEEVVGVGSLIGQQTFGAEASWRSPAVPATTSPMVRRSFETARFSLQKQHTPWQSCVRFALAGSFLKPTKNWMQDVCGIISMRFPRLAFNKVRGHFFLLFASIYQYKKARNK